jgi:hypothetical protein
MSNGRRNFFMVGGGFLAEVVKPELEGFDMPKN